MRAIVLFLVAVAAFAVHGCGSGSPVLEPRPIVRDAFLSQRNPGSAVNFSFTVDPNGSRIPEAGVTTVRWWVYIHRAGTAPGGVESEVITLGQHGNVEDGFATSRIRRGAYAGGVNMLPIESPFGVELSYSLPDLRNGQDVLSARASITYEVGSQRSAVFSDWLTYPNDLAQTP